jgi:plasmid stabilization system protein ParE
MFYFSKGVQCHVHLWVTFLGHRAAMLCTPQLVPYLCTMSQYKVVVADRAVQSLRRLLENVRSTSLIGAEDARTVVLQHLRKLGSNPTNGARKAKFFSLEGDFRSVLAWNYRIYYTIEEKRVVVLDIILDKS